ncbi:MAG TPA: hypothetical protein VEG64_12655 [Candidatus Sulfotelmatobacter sp.]|nr:hypothetical protein [Candidatus Sulfotelmatobacter sp.]
MDNFTDWISSYWFELGSLLFQGATLVALVWFGKSLLKILTASRAHAEATQRAPIPAAPFIERRAVQAPLAEPPASEEPIMETPSYRGVVRGLIPMDPVPAAPQAPIAFGRPEHAGIWHGLLKWLNTPMGNAPVAWRRMVIRRVS